MTGRVTVQVTCLGPLADAVSRRPLHVTCAPFAGEVLDELATAHDAIARMRHHVALAQDTGYLLPEDAVHEGMCLLLVPPVSGG